MERKLNNHILSKILPFFLIGLCSFNFYSEPISIAKKVHLGIFIDTMDNELNLIYKEGIPDSYFSEIFTPVCNTGECLPVKINFFWDLDGSFSHFEMPEGEILTKLDHEPFTEEDYELLTEILRQNQDPRYSGILNHSSTEKGKQGDVSQSSPAPSRQESFKKIDKHAMVDGITGSTLPQQKDKFVPGALYTTYTLWGLAHDSEGLMADYSRKHIYKPFGFQLLPIVHYKIRNEILLNYTFDHQEKNGHANMLMTMIDTVNVNAETLIPILVKNIYFNENKLDTVCTTLQHKYFSSKNDQVKEAILSHWVSLTCEQVIIELSEHIVTDEAYAKKIIYILNNRSFWPDDIAPNILKALPQLKDENQVLYLQLLAENKDKLNQTEQKKLDKEQKRLKGKKEK